jgi:predicted metal-dependent HD superfamily phosphohydrolase
MDVEDNLKARWNATIAALVPRSAVGGRPTADVHQTLVDRYAEPWRHYHTLDHVDDCLEHVAELGGGAGRRPVLEVAVWFHDAVYDPRRRDNEARSAELARRLLAPWELPAEMVARIGALIEWTATHRAPAGDDGAAILLDADLAILGAPPAEYDRYAAAIRREYAHVPAAQYAAGRSAVLRHFLDRAHIYRTPRFRADREAAARANLARELEQYSATP